MKLNAAFNAVFGEAVSIGAVVLENKLVIAKKTAFNTEVKPDTILISNNPLVAADVNFSTDDFQAALTAYHTLKSSKRLIIQADITQYNLENVIDLVGQKENGEEKYNIAMLKNGHWAVLALCLHYFNHEYTSQRLQNALDFMDGFVSQEENEILAAERFFTTI